jgi:hypothetical protein
LCGSSLGHPQVLLFSSGMKQNEGSDLGKDKSGNLF